MWYWKPFKSKYSFYSAIISEMNFLSVNLLMFTFLSADEKKLSIVGWIVISIILISLGASWVNVLLHQLRALKRRKEISERKRLEKMNVQVSIDKLEPKKSNKILNDSRKGLIGDLKITEKIESCQSDENHNELIKNKDKKIKEEQIKQKRELTFHEGRMQKIIEEEEYEKDSIQNTAENQPKKKDNKQHNFKHEDNRVMKSVKKQRKITN